MLVHALSKQASATVFSHHFDCGHGWNYGRPCGPDLGHLGDRDLGHHRLHRRFSRPTAAKAVTRVAAIAPATILAATSGAAERCDVWEGLSALLPPV